MMKMNGGLNLERKIDIIFNSEVDINKSFHLASGYISETTILFEKENVVALINADGRVEFYNMQDELLIADKLPAVEGGKEVYDEVSCQVGNDSITLKFPIYEWIDNYPHCDGEYDRWDTRKIGDKTLVLNLLNNSITQG